MRINNNIMALNTHRQYSINNNNISKSTEKLSSGYRINRAGDDAAGLAISEKMRAQIRGLNMAAKNSNDAISLVQTAEGALTETHAILQRMRELAVQAASDTNDDTVDRAALDAEFQQLKDEIDDIANKTAFNGKKLLDGSFGSTTSVSGSSDIELPDVDVDGTPIPGTNGVVSITFEGFTENGYIQFEKIDDGDLTKGVAYTVTYDGVQLTGIANKAGAQTITLDFGKGRIVTITTDESAKIDGFSNKKLDFTVSNAKALIQTGANAGDELEISISSMKAADLGITDSVNIKSQTDASSAISTVTTAINTVSTQRAKLGALQNRLEHKINNLETSAENLTAAESRIRDIDMAKEMTEFTKHNILVQASTAMLAQANQAPQNVLALLK
mgnify:CR=1 FL=1